eukprot:5592124-Pleurochrysis_carterae.AAC.1
MPREIRAVQRRRRCPLRTALRRVRGRRFRRRGRDSSSPTAGRADQDRTQCRMCLPKRSRALPLWRVQRHLGSPR